MKICIVHNYLLTGSGSSTYVLGLSKALAKAGHNVVVISREPNYRRFGFFSTSYTQTAHGWEKKEANARPFAGTAVGYTLTFQPYLGIETHPECNPPFFPNCPQPTLDAYITSYIDALRSIAHHERPECFHANHIAPLPYIVAQVATPQVPYIVTLHGSHIEYVLRKDSRYIPYAVSGLGGAHSVIVTARDVQERCEEFVTLPPTHFSLIPVGVDTTFFTPQHSQGATNISFIGKLIPDKGAHLLPYIFALILRRSQNVKLQIVGTGELLTPLVGLQKGSLTVTDFYHNVSSRRAVLDELLEEAHIPDQEVAHAMQEHSNVHGSMLREQLPEVLGSSAVCLVPSLLHEALPMVVLEALSSGALPIMPDTSGFREIVRRIRSRVPPLSPVLSVEDGHFGTSMAQCAVSALELLRAEGGREVQNELRSLATDEYDWDSIAMRIATIYGDARRP